MQSAQSTVTREARSFKRRLVQRTLVNMRSSLDWAWLDVVCQYRRSKIGPFWETINVAVMVAGLSLVSSAIFGGDISDLIGYIGIGIILWAAISSIVVEGCSTFARNASEIRFTNISIDLYVGRTIFKIFITFGHQIMLYAVGLVLGYVTIGWTCLLALPGLLLIFVNAYWIVTVLGFMCARFRDLEPIVRNLMQLAFLATPVFWNHQQMVNHRRFLVDYNPLFHFISIVRMPLLGEVPAAQSYLVVFAVMGVGYSAAYFAYLRMRRHLAFFV